MLITPKVDIIRFRCSLLVLLALGKLYKRSVFIAFVVPHAAGTATVVVTKLDVDPALCSRTEIRVLKVLKLVRLTHVAPSS